MKEHIVLDAFKDAVSRNKHNVGMIVPTDQGAQYTSHKFQKLLLEKRCLSSMSRKGNPYDNAVMESFYKTLKTGLGDIFPYENRKVAERSAFEYIEFFYKLLNFSSSL